MPKKIKSNLAYYLFYFIIMCKYGGTTVNDVDDKNDAIGIDSNVDKKSTQMSGHLFFHFFCSSTS